MLVHLEGKAYNQSYIKCPDCKQVMVLKLSKDKENIYYSCDNFPACSNFHPAWPNGEAQGEVVSRAVTLVSATQPPPSKLFNLDYSVYVNSSV